MVGLRVGFLGDGHLNGMVHRAVRESRPYRVVGVYDRDAVLPRTDAVDVVVEAATQQAVRERVPMLLAEGIDVIVLSVGALADAAVRFDLLRQIPGRGLLIPCTGAIGGVDQVRALRTAGPLDSVSLETRKLPGALIQPWMPSHLMEVLRAGDTEVVLADGPAAEVAQRFPASANVAAALALAADAWDVATARVVADPSAAQTRHEICASGALGEVRAIVRNAPSVERPRSSAIVAWAALRALDDYARLRGFPGAGDVTFL